MENRTMTWQNELEEALAALISAMAEPDRKEKDSAVECLRLQVTDVISRHQILTELLPTSDHWHLHSLSVGYPYNTEKLKFALTDHVLHAARETGIATASRACEAFLSGAAETCLPGFDLTFFAGLDLTERWDIAPGQYAAPYPTIQRQFARPRARFPNPMLFDLDPKGEKKITALVTELRWGPAITDANRKLTDPDPMKIELANDRAPLLVVALLSVVLGRSLPVIASAIRPAPWIDDFLDRVGGSGTYFDREGGIGSTDSNTVSAEDKAAAERAIRNWDLFAKSDRETLAIAIARLSTSLSRRGSWAMPNLAIDDGILDVSIALEILYRLDSSEITHKLSTRAGWYVGSSEDQRLRTRKYISDFYGLRSGIIHGRRRGKKDQERASQDRKRALQVNTYDIAKATVLEHLKRDTCPMTSNGMKSSWVACPPTASRREADDVKGQRVFSGAVKTADMRHDVAVYTAAPRRSCGARHWPTRQTYARHRIRHRIRHTASRVGRCPCPSVANDRLRNGPAPDMFLMTWGVAKPCCSIDLIGDASMRR